MLPLEQALRLEGRKVDLVDVALVAVVGFKGFEEVFGLGRVEVAVGFEDV